MNKVSEAMADLVAKVQSVAAFEKKTFECYDPPDLLRQITAVPAPAVGVVYLGMESQSEQGAAKTGAASNATFALYLLVDTPSILPSMNRKGQALELLNDLRLKIMGNRAPGGHLWAFMHEGLEDSTKDRTIWQQRWVTPIVLQR